MLSDDSLINNDKPPFQTDDLMTLRDSFGEVVDGERTISDYLTLITEYGGEVPSSIQPFFSQLTLAAQAFILDTEQSEHLKRSDVHFAASAIPIYVRALFDLERLADYQDQIMEEGKPVPPQLNDALTSIFEIGMLQYLHARGVRLSQHIDVERLVSQAITNHFTALSMMKLLDVERLRESIVEQSQAMLKTYLTEPIIPVERLLEIAETSMRSLGYSPEDEAVLLAGILNNLDILGENGELYIEDIVYYLREQMDVEIEAAPLLKYLETVIDNAQLGGALALDTAAGHSDYVLTYRGKPNAKRQTLDTLIAWIQARRGLIERMQK